MALPNFGQEGELELIIRNVAVVLSKGVRNRKNTGAED